VHLRRRVSHWMSPIFPFERLAQHENTTSTLFCGVMRALLRGGTAPEGERVALLRRRLATEGERVALLRRRLATEGERVALLRRRLATEGERVALLRRRLATEGERVASAELRRSEEREVVTDRLRRMGGEKSRKRPHPFRGRKGRGTPNPVTAGWVCHSTERAKIVRRGGRKTTTHCEADGGDAWRGVESETHGQKGTDRGYHFADVGAENTQKRAQQAAALRAG